MAYTAIRLLNFRPAWKRAEFYYETREEMLKQLDVLFLLKRINFLEKSLSLLFSDHQLKALHLASHFSLAEAAELRRAYRLKARLKAEVQQQLGKD